MTADKGRKGKNGDFESRFWGYALAIGLPLLLALASFDAHGVL